MGIRVCPNNWTRYDRTKSCFSVIEQRLRWSEAEQICEDFGGHLASITDEYENIFAFEVAKKANLSVQTIWLGRIVKLAKTGAYEWNDGSVGRHADGFRGGELIFCLTNCLPNSQIIVEPPSGTDICLTMWLDFDRPEGSWNEWDCNYATGYSALCKKSYKKASLVSATVVKTTDTPNIYSSKRCCVSTMCSSRCSPNERCIPDDLDCLTKTCENHGPGWCLPAV
ncbi:unnamed protein product [Dracunculus medinensis]|uniref:C-type lectin domain-containing protein n=1 Tax=Dracunculus medinensis TaxID=318479 RepID=A0A0N4U5W5_DRAME|nr:unnamed protein product [Dracunculus medinensis]